ncbi:MAG: type II secretion system F family protein [Mycobacteriales bacterium]|jgi:Flp pilus assembly protein TadB
MNLPLIGLEGLGAGVIAACGIVLLVVAIRGTYVKPKIDRPGEHKQSRSSVTIRLLLAAAVAVLVLVFSRWVVAAIASFALVYLWPSLFGAKSSSNLAIRRLEALAAWCESLRDTIAGAVGLEQAIPASLAAVNETIRPHVGLMVDRLRTRQPLHQVLERFADDLDDPSADLMIAALILNSKLRGPGLRDVLGALSTSTREELDMRRRVEAARKSTRRSAQIVVGVTLVVAGGLTFLNRNFVQPYDSAQGQMVLIFVVAIFALGFLWLRKLADFERPDRFLRTGVDSLLIQEDE